MIDLRLGNVLDVLAQMPSESVHCIVTSPPYWGLRAYGTEPQVWRNGSEPCDVHEWGESQIIDTGRRDHETRHKWDAEVGRRPREYESTYIQNKASNGNTCTRCGAWRGELGLEPTPELYVEHIVAVMREARRVLRDDGTLWLNIGDSFASGGAGRNDYNHRADGHAGGMSSKHSGITHQREVPAGLKPKDLVGIPWRVAFALQADGWTLRSDIIWSKPNPMPESVRDRPTKAHEYLFLLAKQPRYYYDAEAVREQNAPDYQEYKGRHVYERNAKTYDSGHGVQSLHGAGNDAGKYAGCGRNRRSVWTVTTSPFSGAKLLADYVGDDGKPYRASLDCPLHSHLARSQMSDTQSGGEQSNLSESHNPDKRNGHVQSPLSESASTTLIHSGECGLSQNVLAQIPESIGDNRTLIDQIECILPVQNLSHTTRTLESHAPSGYKTDSSCQQCDSPANGHNKRKSKSARVRHTSQHDSACAQTLFDTHRTLQSDAQTDSADHTCESNSAVDSVSSATLPNLSGQTDDHSVDRQIEVSSKPLYCTCEIVSIDHFATFPPKLIEPCILASTSQRGVCSKCGAPWVRVTKIVKSYKEQPSYRDGDTQTFRAGSGGNHAGHSGNFATTDRAFMGWRASCACDAGEPVPATVLDPFNGAGTTGLVALQHGRRYIGIDLKQEYLDMTRERLDKAQLTMAAT